MLAALAGGAALMGRKKGNVERTAAMEDANVGINTRPSLIDAQDAGTNWKKKAVTNLVKPTAPVPEKDTVVTTGAPKHIVSRSRNKVVYSDGTVDTPGTIYQKNKLSAGNKIPPSMRTGAPHAEGYQKYGIIGTDRTGGGRPTVKRGWTGTPSLRAKGGRIGAKKGGRVTGIAKRGFGRALMKGKK